MAVSKLPVRSCLIDGEAIVCDDDGLAVFELIRRHGAGEHAVLTATSIAKSTIWVSRSVRLSKTKTARKLKATPLGDSCPD
jgi:hypothetical protein